MADETRKTTEEFEDPELLDLEELQDVSGGGTCITGGNTASNLGSGGDPEAG